MLPEIGREFITDDPSEGMLLRMVNGCRATILGVDADEYKYSLFEVDIVGTHGRIRFVDNGDVCEIFEVTPYKHYSDFNELKRTKKMQTQMPSAIKFGLEMMIGSLSNGTWQDISEGVNALRNIEIACNARKIVAGSLSQ